MPKFEEVQRYAFADVQTLVFAGGGNRCWWQAGALRHLMERGMRLPSQLIGTSAGAAVAASFVTGSSDVALATCLRLYAENARVFNWSGLSSRMRNGIMGRLPVSGVRLGFRRRQFSRRWAPIPADTVRGPS